jgi:TolB-like protein
MVMGLLGLMLCGSVAGADPAATQPSSPTGDVYLLPFAAIGGDTRLDWAGKAVQQNLLTDLARARLHPAAADQPIASADAQASAKAAGARYLITGTYQTTDQLLRFNGQILDVATGNVLGGITATGAERDLFSMEDSLSAQAIQQLSRLPGIVAGQDLANAQRPAAQVPPALQPAAVAILLQPPAAAAGSSYDGSALQQYVDSNRTPSNDFEQQLQDARDRNTYAPYTDYGTYGGYYGNYGVGLYYGGGLQIGGFGYSSGFGGHGFPHGFGAGGYFNHGAAHGRW